MPNIIVGRYKYVDPDKEMYLGHEFEKNGKRSLDKRCGYCGEWFTFDIKDLISWGDNIQRGFNGWPEKVHCGSEHCQEYHRRVKQHERRMLAELHERHLKLFIDLQNKGLIS